jgi:monoamine oxidase
MCETVDTEALKVDIYNIKPSSADFKDSSFAQWLTDRGFKQGMAMDYMRYLVRALLGVEPEEISAFYFLDYVKSGLGTASLSLDNAGGAQYMRVRQG